MLDCLEELNCWCAVLLFEAGCCIVSEGRDLSFQDLHLLSALDYFTKSCSITSSSEKASREAFHYLRLCSRLVSGQVSDSNFRDTVTAADPVPWAHIPAAPQCGLPADTSAEADAAANRLALFRRHLADYVLDLAGMDMAEAKRMACAVYATDMDQLIAATNRSPRTQFELLSAVMEHHLCGDTRLAPVQSPSEEDSPPPVIDTSVYLRHVSLLLAESPTDLFHFLLRSTRTRCVFPVEDCLLMCTDALTDIQVAMLKPAGSDTDSNTNNSPTGSTKPGQGQGQTRWILLDSISLLKQLSGDLSGAMSAIIEYVTFALSEERRNRKGIPPRGLQGGGSDRGQRVLHGVQCLLNLCETENTRQGGHYTHTQSREGMWFGALTSLLPILGQCDSGLNIHCKAEMFIRV